MKNILKFIVGFIALILFGSLIGCLIYLIFFNFFLFATIVGSVALLIMAYYFGEVIINEWEKYFK